MIQKAMTPIRLGPRPLALHLMTQAFTLLASLAALPSWRNGCFAWKPHLLAAAEELRLELDGVDPAAFRQVLNAEAWQRLDGFLKGVEAYRHHPSWRRLPDMPLLWQEGSTRLFDYSLPGADGPPLLVIPSLINRATILDLTPRRSLMRYLASKGLRPFLVDWGTPGPAEKKFGLDDYVAGRLVRMLEAVLLAAGRPFVAGYCMGGLLGLGLGLLRPQDVRGLALLATPWDFHAPEREKGRLVAALEMPLDHAIALHGELPVDLLQAMFTVLDPAGVERKFRAFQRMNKRSRQARDFVAVEDWLNDGVPLTAKVARETLFGWYVDNLPGRGEWRLDDRAMRPAGFAKPALVLVPRQDTIVPPASALALAAALPKAALFMVDSGHIGMIAGARAATEVYARLVRWAMRS
jgi:polyhydroxyalkanoate synthase